VPPAEEPKVICVLGLSPLWKDRAYLFTEEEAVGLQWLQSVGYRQKPTVEAALYLPLHSLGLPPYPSTNGALYERLKACDPDALQKLLKFLSGRARPTAVLFSIPTTEGWRAMGTWWHPRYFHQSYQRGRSKLHSGAIKGFRPGHHPVSFELSGENRKEKLLCATVERVDRQRLSLRSAGEVLADVEHPVNIIGCGSVGGQAAALLAGTGTVGKLRLIDPEKLTIENVARHYCGMSDVNEYKTIATAAKVQRHLPHVQFETRQMNILDILRADQVWLMPTSFNLVSIGNWAVERRLNQVAMAAAEPSAPHCYIWVEPHLYAGHALLVRKGGRGCFECAFDDSFLFRYRVVTDPRGFSLREAGCRSTYVPYSNLYLSEFVSAAVRFLLQHWNNPKNQVFSWLGDLEAAKRSGVALGQDWASAHSFSSTTREIGSNHKCPVCSA
jgi:hypothetical protein